MADWYHIERRTMLKWQKALISLCICKWLILPLYTFVCVLACLFLCFCASACLSVSVWHYGFLSNVFSCEWIVDLYEQLGVDRAPNENHGFQCHILQKAKYNLYSFCYTTQMMLFFFSFYKGLSNKFWQNKNPYFSQNWVHGGSICSICHIKITLRCVSVWSSWWSEGMKVMTNI